MARRPVCLPTNPPDIPTNALVRTRNEAHSGWDGTQRSVAQGVHQLLPQQRFYHNPVQQNTNPTYDDAATGTWQGRSSGRSRSNESLSSRNSFGSALGDSGWDGARPSFVLSGIPSDDTSLYITQRLHAFNTAPSASSPNPRQHQRHPSNRDEFDGPCQYLDRPNDGGCEPREQDLPQLPATLHAREQDHILTLINDRLSQCAFDFIARYQFPIPLEPDKRPVRVPSDREWSEWVQLLKKLTTKRRIPTRVLYNGQIRQFITILENSLEMRHAAMHQSRPLKDDRNILQLISSGLQVAKILKDAPAMQFLDKLYTETERMIHSRRGALSH